MNERPTQVVPQHLQHFLKVVIYTMSITGTLFIGAGIIHNSFGLIIPELRAPTLRVLQTRSIQGATVAEHYEHECAFWFHMAGLSFMLIGSLINSYVADTGKREAPQWFGLSMSAISGVGCWVMPESGWWMILAFSLWSVWNQPPKQKSEKMT